MDNEKIIWNECLTRHKRSTDHDECTNVNKLQKNLSRANTSLKVSKCFRMKKKSIQILNLPLEKINKSIQNNSEISIAAPLPILFFNYLGCVRF